jgi:hypothetical protein
MMNQASPAGIAVTIITNGSRSRKPTGLWAAAMEMDGINARHWDDRYFCNQQRFLVLSGYRHRHGPKPTAGSENNTQSMRIG